MPAKKIRRAIGLDFQCTFAAHIEANQRAQEWAVKYVNYREAGKTIRAKHAEQKARYWLKKAMMLEAKTGGPPLPSKPPE
jgi:outer membrane PBP1 activator LpoA protein